MVNTQKCLAIVFFLICTPAFADNANDPFQEVAAKYIAANPKPILPEEARKFKVQAEFMVQEKQPEKAVELYGKALNIAPWWPEGHFKLGLILGESKKYRDATQEMKHFLLLAPDSPDARAAQDKIYQWEVVIEPEAGKTFKDCPECPEMVEIPAGSFDMGSSSGESNEKPVHHVTLAKSFAIGKTEVTQEQWHALMGTNPSSFTTCGDTCPVEQVSWDDTQLFIQKLNTKTGKQYRLPTEAEWEYACRAGNQQEYCGSDNVDKVSWNNRNSGSYFFNHPIRLPATGQCVWAVRHERQCGNGARILITTTTMARQPMAVRGRAVRCECCAAVHGVTMRSSGAPPGVPSSGPHSATSVMGSALRGRSRNLRQPHLFEEYW